MAKTKVTHPLQSQQPRHFRKDHQMMVVEDGLPYSGISTANAGTVGPVCSDVVTAAAAAAPPLQLDRTQQSMILEELTVSRQKLEEENQILRDELNEAKLVIRFLKFRLLQQEYQHEQEQQQQQQQQTDENKNKSSRNLAGGATSDLDPHQRSILGVLQQHQQLQKHQQQQQQQQQQQFTGNSPPSNTTCLDPVHITALWSDLMQALDLAAEQKAAGVTTTMTRKNKKKKLTGTANESKRLLRHKAFRNPVASGQRLFGSHNNNNNNKTTNQNKNNSRSNAAETSGAAAPKEGATLRSSSSSALWVEEWNNRNHPVLAAAADKGGKENKDVPLENGVPKEITMEVSVPPVTTITNTTTTTVVTPKSQSAPLSMIVEEQEDNDGQVELLLHRSTATTTTSLSSLSPPLGLRRSGSSPMTRSTKSALSHDQQQQRRHCLDGARRSQSVPKLRHF